MFDSQRELSQRGGAAITGKLNSSSEIQPQRQPKTENATSIIGLETKRDIDQKDEIRQALGKMNDPTEPWNWKKAEVDKFAKEMEQKLTGQGQTLKQNQEAEALINDMFKKVGGAQVSPDQVTIPQEAKDKPKNLVEWIKSVLANFWKRLTT